MQKISKSTRTFLSSSLGHGILSLSAVAIALISIFLGNNASISNDGSGDNVGSLVDSDNDVIPDTPPEVPTEPEEPPTVSIPSKILENKIYGFSVHVPEKGVWDYFYDKPTTSSLNLEQISHHVNTITIIDTSQPRNLEEIIQIEIITGQKFTHPKDLIKLIDVRGSTFTTFSSTFPNSTLVDFEYFFNACNDISRGGLNCKILGNINIKESNDISYIIHAASFEDKGDPKPQISDEAKLILNSFRNS